MIAVLVVAVAALSAAGGSLVTHRHHQRTQLAHELDGHWTPEDHEALKQEAAVERCRAAHEHRSRRRAEQVARNLTEIVIAPTRAPIPAPPRSTR